MTTTVETDSKLLERLRKAAGKPITREELEQQRVSFVYGNLPKDSTITREKVAERIRGNEGV